MFYRLTEKGGVRAVDLDDTQCGGVFIVVSSTLGAKLGDETWDLLDQPGSIVTAVNSAIEKYQPYYWVMTEEPTKFQGRYIRDGKVVKFVQVEHHKLVVEGEEVCSLPNVLCYGVRKNNGTADIVTRDRDLASDWGEGGLNEVVVSISVMYRLGFRRLYIMGLEKETPTLGRIREFLEKRGVVLWVVREGKMREENEILVNEVAVEEARGYREVRVEELKHCRDGEDRPKTLADTIVAKLERDRQVPQKEDSSWVRRVEEAKKRGVQ